MIHELLGVFFPELCIGCNRSLLKNEKYICASCLFHLPVTNYHFQQNNPLEKIFWGRIKIERAYAFLMFRKGNITQHLLHELKYKGNKELGVFIGNLYGQALKEYIRSIDAVISIPLHISKLRKRGYNQSDFFAEGLSAKLGVENLSEHVKRKVATETQTKKSRFERWENVDSIFEIQNPHLFKNKHILLVDDVITTGATIEACAKSFESIDNLRLSISSIAIADH